MLRLKIILTFILSILLVTLVAYFAHRGALSSAIEQDAEESLRRAATVAELERRLAEAALVDKAMYVGSAPDLHEAILADYSTKENPDGEEPLEVAPDLARHERHLKVHERLDRYRIEFEQYYKSGPGKEMRQLDVPLQWLKPERPDLFFAVDKSGVGLAAIGKDLLKWYGDDVSKAQILVSEALTKNEVRTGLMTWTFDPKTDPKGQLYLVAVSPISINRTQDPVGAVVVGSLISDGTAKRVKEMMAGVYEQGLEQSESSRVMLSAPEIAYFYEDSVVGSTFDTSTQKQLAQMLFKDQKVLEQAQTDKVTEVELADTNYIVRVREMPGMSDLKARAGIIALANLDYAQKPVNAPGTTTLIVGVMVALLGTIIMLIFIQLFLRPLEKIETSIQEVAAGNRDLVFDYRGDNKLAQGIAHQLNLMSAFLQGKPMHDDEESGGGWGEMAGGAPGTGGPNPQVKGVNMSDLMGKKPSSSDEG